MSEISMAPETRDDSDRRSRVRRVLGCAAAAGAGLLVVAGGWLMTRSDNPEDFSQISAFTSASGQENRANYQAAFDGQDTMYEYFHTEEAREAGVADEDGITAEFAEVIAPTVGLTGPEVESLINTKLEGMDDFDGDESYASTYEFTLGAIAATAGVAGLTGAGAVYAVTRRRED